MQIEAVHDALHVRVGPTFRSRDVERFQEALAALTPFSSLTFEFGSVRECEDAALVLLARALGAIPAGEIVLRGLTDHQWRLLTYVGLDPDRGEARDRPRP